VLLDKTSFLHYHHTAHIVCSLEFSSTVGVVSSLVLAAVLPFDYFISLMLVSEREYFIGKRSVETPLTLKGEQLIS
jgi:hypothetical protein